MGVFAAPDSVKPRLLRGLQCPTVTSADKDTVYDSGVVSPVFGIRPIAKEYDTVGEIDAAAAQSLTTIPANDVPSLVTGIGQWLHHGFCFPGDYMLSTYGPVLSRFVDLPVVPGSTLAGVVAGVVWLSALILILKVCRWIYDAYITIAAYATRGQQASLRVGRNVSRRLRIAAKGSGLRRQARVAPTISEEVELGELEHAVLRCHGGLPADRRLTVEGCVEDGEGPDIGD